MSDDELLVVQLEQIDTIIDGDYNHVIKVAEKSRVNFIIIALTTLSMLIIKEIGDCGCDLVFNHIKHRLDSDGERISLDTKEAALKVMEYLSKQVGFKPAKDSGTCH